MRVALVGQKHYPYTRDMFIGGREISEHCMLQLLSGVDDVESVDYITTKSSATPLTEKDNVTVVSTGVPSVSEMNNPTRGELMSASRDRNRNIKNIIASNHYDFVLINDDNPSLRYASARDLAHVPIAALFHIPPSLSPGAGVHNYIDSMIEMNNAGQTVVHVTKQSADLFYKFAKKFDGKLKNPVDKQFIYYIIPPVYIEHHEELLNEKKESGYVVFIGRPARWKRHDIAIELCAANNLPLHMITNEPGDNSERKFLEKIKKMGPDLLGDKFHLHYNITEEEKNRIIRDARMHLLCSDGESFGVTVIEAGALGVPTFLFSKKPEQQCAASLLHSSYLTKEPSVAGAAKEMYNYYMSCNQYLSREVFLETISNYSKSSLLQRMQQLINVTISRNDQQPDKMVLEYE